MTFSLDHLANHAKLRTYIDLLKSIVEAAEQQLCLRSDDLDEARRLGGLVQVIRVQSDSRPHGRARN
jgi:hypothetical protein